ncbi:hypothetical protein [Amedibacterium intestinale]|uniref:hypothetical protein n=1 Tax=Amedibacterium intestinale TaxID=2583452 RepID=UPI000E492A28|nr:hypothetical protein [Amedibacterium intestinale]RHO20818.1 hypothetical protein DW220_08715 [Eubacterium sp. AM18-26]RHO26228.1 hypothetical protein DW212_05980 [Eubacterium sp. AM18-10LB-B]
MKETLYLNKELAILNYSAGYARNPEQLLKSSTFSNYVHNYIDYLKEADEDLYYYVINGKTARESTVELIKLFRMLRIFKIDEIESPYLHDKGRLLELIEEMYNFWKRHQRFSVIHSGSGNALQDLSFVQADSNFNNLILAVYRSLEEEIMGRKNRVYRQMQAGTNAAISVQNLNVKLSDTYAALKDIPFITSVMLRTPMILHPKSNKRTGMFTETENNPIHEFSGDKDTWFCYPCKIGSLLAFVYFHRDFISSAVSLGNLFELATVDECRKKPDLICLFGNEDGKDQTTFHYDKEEDIWIGCVSYNERIEYFGYLKKMSLTLHNVRKMQHGWLPIHGAFVNITLKNGKRKGIMLMGDSGAGKSESIEALKIAGKDVIKDIEVVFDDMGTIHLEDGIPYGQGTEIGAFIRLDDLDPGTPYRDMDRSIFMNPESSNNARVITPAAPYEIVAMNHRIDLFAYANNYDDKLGLHRFDNIEDAKATCVEGKRMAKGTTQEVGISTTYFANPFGPMQQQEVCDPLIDKMFKALRDNGVFVGEIYTHLGLSKENRDGINLAAKQLLEFIEKD